MSATTGYGRMHVKLAFVLAVVILSSTSVLAGLVPPSTRTPTNAASTVKGQR
jgi:hypothetical protein